MHLPPPSVYETWPKPNYVDPETRGHGLIYAGSILIGVVLVVVTLRCYTRCIITKSFGLDDIFILLAMFPCLGLAACTIAGDAAVGFNRHIWDIKPADMKHGLMLEFACIELYIWSSVLTKMSVIYFCRRLLSTSHPAWYKPGLTIFAALTFTGFLVYAIVFCFACQPISAYWDSYPPTWKPSYPYTCVDIGEIWLSGALLNCVWDMLTWMVPLPIVYQLHLPVRQRVAAMALFGLGICVIVAGIVKTVYVQIGFNTTYDCPWKGWPIWICASVEISLGIICASAPSLRPFFSHFCPRPARHWPGRNSYAQMSRGRDVPSPDDELGMSTPLSPIVPTHNRLESTGSADDMKPWSYNSSRGSSRQTSRRGSLTKIETSVTGSRPNSCTPNTLTPATPIAKRLTPVREIEPVSGTFSEDFKFNQTAALPPPEEDGELGPTDVTPTSPVERPERSASPSWWRGRRRTLSAGKSGPAIGSVDRTEFESSGDDQSSETPPALKLDTELQVHRRSSAASDEIAPPSAVSTVSTSTKSLKRHSRKKSDPREFETFNFDQPATSSRRGSENNGNEAEARVNEFPPPPSYGEFVENNSWIRDDQNLRRGSDATIHAR